ncbi:site-specific DNA-methyltransferase [Aliarcobacter cryaerophilus]|uniref:site-specific DNA-methyltransferase n=1 Tax=Aliarcobacter cryaerophilus TaxID=28198 RepID=UPI0021B675F3|nr:site-specific DNA-methyltransferase [Aliarcobacter cryaerophilus]MCT7460949.1 site-specific DNA-methyltransferase [Aliarcobacter cryaerophilus]
MKKYENYTKEQLIQKIKQLESKKYGLIWDDEKEPEKVVIECQNNIPILKKIDEKTIKTDIKKPTNILIEGDNYHTLQVLNYTHKGQIDVIYIDPPYNTGNKDFKYNDSFIDKEDGYRHSKWLNFMNKRLRLAHNLLKDDGVIFISIGKDELSQLVLLVKNIFGEDNYLDMLPREQKAGSDQGTYFSPQLDYIVVATKNKNILEPFYISSKNKKTPKSLYQSSLDPLRGCNNQRYWIKCPDGSFIIPPGNFFPELIKDGSNRSPESKDDNVWRWSVDSYLKDIAKPKEERRLFFKETFSGALVDENGNPSKWNIYVIPEDLEENKNTPRDYIFKFTNDKGSKILKDMGLEFNNPKPIELIQYLINITNKPNDILVLDFFAGSGTTGQAILELNQQDDGDRTFILCTNNENDICKEVTYPRISKVINGFDFEGDNKNTLLEKKLTFSNFYKNIKQKKTESIDDYQIRKEKQLSENINKIWKEIDEVIVENIENFDEIKKEFDGEFIKLIGINKIKNFKNGISGNLDYYKTDLIPTNGISNITDSTREELTKKAGNMIAIKENTHCMIELCEHYQIFINEATKKQTAIYFTEDLSYFYELIEKTKSHFTKLYIFSFGKIDKSSYKYLGKNFSIEDIPEPIIEIYKEINKEGIL